MTSLPRRAVRKVRKHLRAGSPPPTQDEERAAYEWVAALGRDSDNPWIRKSSEAGGWLFEGEHEFLWELATRRTRGNILEIGTWMGKSACILAGACAEKAPGTVLYCVDPFDMSGTPEQEAYHRRLVPEQGTYYRFKENAERLGFAPWVVPIAAMAERALPHIPGGLRMAFVDGAHDYQGVRADTFLVLSKLSIGGVLALHDARSEACPDIGRFVEDELSKDPRVRYLAEKGSVVAFEVMEGPSQ